MFSPPLTRCCAACRTPTESAEQALCSTVPEPPWSVLPAVPVLTVGMESAVSDLGAGQPFLGGEQHGPCARALTFRLTTLSCPSGGRERRFML